MVLSLVAALALSPAALGGEPRSPWDDLVVCETWGTDDGLPQCSVNHVVQTRDGFLWIATHGGLGRFDGREFQTFGAATPGLGAARITRLFESRSGELWIGTSINGVARYRDGRFERVPAANGWGPGWVGAIAEDGAGDLWVGALGLYLFREGVLEPVQESQPFSVVSDLLPTAAGDLILATDQGVMRRTAEGRFEVLIEDQEQDFRHLVDEGNGRIWGFGGRPELFCLSDVVTRYPQDSDALPIGPLANYVRNGLSDSSGRILFVGDRRLWQLACEESRGGAPRRAWLEPTLDLGPGGPGLSINADRHGNVWIGRGTQGLQRLHRLPYRLLAGDWGEMPIVWGLFGDGQGGVVAQFMGGEFLRFSSDLSFETLPIAKPKLTATAVSPDGSWWFGEGADVVHVDRAGELLECIPTGLRDLRALTFASDGALWIGGWQALARYFDGSLASVSCPMNATPHAIVPDAAGGARFLSSAALGRFDGEALELLHAGQELPEAELRALRVDPDGCAWVTTYGAGLARVRGREVKVYATGQGLLDAYLGGIEEDAQGRFYLNSNRGVLVVARADIEAFDRGELSEIPCRQLLTGEGNGPMSHRTPDGLLWFPTMAGLAVVDPSRDRAVVEPPNLQIVGLALDGREVDPAESLVFPPGDGNLEVGYVAPSFVEPGGVRYRYRLEGRDRDWVDAGSSRTAIYRSLPPGEYVFHAKASIGAGGWSSEQSAAFLLRAHFWQTWWFFGLVGVLLVLAGFGLHLARVTTLREHGRALQAEIRERKVAEEERRRAEEQLRESSKLEAVGRLAGGIAHDFNNVLTAILGHVDLLKSKAGGLTAAEIARHVEAIETCSDKATSLTQQLLAFSRRQVLRPRVLDVNGVVLGVERLLTHLLPETVELCVRPAPDTGFVRADPSQLEQVVMNLVLNARDAMPKGGVLVVETRRETQVIDGEVRPHALISVEDTGSGIRPSDLPHVFEPFFTTKGPGGTGLGLASVQGIVVQSGGFVRVESTPGRGTTFRVFLPSVQEPLTAPASLPARSSAHRGSETVLVCDDYKPLHSVTRLTLESYGYRVLVADHPAHAIELARAAEPPPAVLVTDVVMPGMSGRELADRMLCEYPHLRVLFISGYTANPSLREQATAGEVAFLAKPFKPEDLARRVREVLDQDALARPHP